MSCELWAFTSAKSLGSLLLSRSANNGGNAQFGRVHDDWAWLPIAGRTSSWLTAHSSKLTAESRHDICHPTPLTIGTTDMSVRERSLQCAGRKRSTGAEDVSC